MTYVMSDLHGMYDKYMAMLEKISFSEDDILYLLGDVVDRGDRPVDILLDMMGRANVYPIMGNHDIYAKSVLKKLNVTITEENYNTQIDNNLIMGIVTWMQDGGTSTIKQFKNLDKEKRRQVLNYFNEFSLAEAIDVGEKTFILVHAGLNNFRKDKKLREYTGDELLLGRPNPDKKLFDDDSIYVVMGHTPTPTFTGKPEIYIRNNNIFIDCGACSSKGRLGCLCLDSMEEFYV